VPEALGKELGREQISVLVPVIVVAKIKPTWNFCCLARFVTNSRKCGLSLILGNPSK
jgi:hypothetical protein